MPRAQLTPDEKKGIIKAVNKGKSIGDVARKYNRTKKTIKNLVKRVEKTGSTERKTKLSKESKKQIRRAMHKKVTPTLTQVKQTLDVDVSEATISRYLTKRREKRMPELVVNKVNAKRLLSLEKEMVALREELSKYKKVVASSKSLDDSGSSEVTESSIDEDDGDIIYIKKENIDEYDPIELHEPVQNDMEIEEEVKEEDEPQFDPNEESSGEDHVVNSILFMGRICNPCLTVCKV